MSSSVEKIKERLSVTEVIESYIKLDKSGNSYKGKCPFHNEKTPSFFVSPERGTYYCFGCGAKGDIFSFVEHFEGLDFVGALKVLANRAGVVLEYTNKSEHSEKEKMHRILEEATVYFEAELEKNKIARAYIMSRGITENTLAHFRIGYAPDSWQGLFDHLKVKGFSSGEIEKVGLAKPSQKEGSSTSHYDTFRGRIMFPISDAGGRVIAFSGRIIIESEKAPKYLNSPDTPLFKKSEVLYGIDKAKLDIRKRNYTIVVEGQMDLVMSHQAGFTNTVAVSGTAFADSLSDSGGVVNNLGLIMRLSNNIILAFDGDGAGLKASERSTKIALSLGADIKIAHLKKGEDPADIIKRDPVEWKKIIQSAERIIDFYLSSLLEMKLEGQKLARLVKEKVLPFVARIGSAVEQSHYVRDISSKTGFREEALWDDLKKIPNENAPPVAQVSYKSTISKGESLERKIWGIIWWQEESQETKIEDTVKLRSELVRILGRDEAEESEKRYSSVKSEMVFEADITYNNSKKEKSEMREVLLRFEDEVLREQFAKVMQELARAERGKEKEKVEVLLRECQDISKRISELKTLITTI